MDEVIAWAGFLGAWLLVAGPLFQGAMELREQDLDHEGMEAAASGIPKPAPPSRWWWLLPPVMYLIRRRQQSRYQKAAFAALDEHQRAQYVGFINKATGWFTVAGGALLLAAKETWELVEHHDWPLWVFVTLMVVLAVASVVNTAVRMMRAERMSHPDRGRVSPAAPGVRTPRSPRG
jgi:hypothetical protein